jgi:hypothetical protein
MPPGLSWNTTTEEFRARFTEAYAAKPTDQSTDEFARAFVDQWPDGMAAMRLEPSRSSELARPPYASADGLWPAFLHLA